MRVLAVLLCCWLLLEVGVDAQQPKSNDPRVKDSPQESSKDSGNSTGGLMDVVLVTGTKTASRSKITVSQAQQRTLRANISRILPLGGMFLGPIGAVFETFAQALKNLPFPALPGNIPLPKSPNPFKNNPLDKIKSKF